MMCREGDDKPVVCVLEGEDRHLEGEDCKIVVLEATTETLARVRVVKIGMKVGLSARNGIQSQALELGLELGFRFRILS